MDCIFCKIAKKEVLSEIIYEIPEVVVFKDITPISPVHLLIIPKRHISSINRLEVSDKNLIGELFLTAQKVARDQGVDKTGYRLIFNIGADAGQTIDHLHLHLLGGKKLPWV